MTDSQRLSRSLGTSDAVVIGLGSMIGAGVFAVWTPAAQVAGSALLVGLLVAAVVSYCNATSSAQLAAQYPTSGGTYVYGREQLGEWWGFLAGWAFVVGKTASCAAMAMTFAAYAVPGPGQRAAAVGAVLVVAWANYRGVSRTARMTRIIVVVVLGTLAVMVLASILGGDPDPDRLLPLTAGHGWYDVLQSAGLLFFAFAGYARIATLGEEVRDPARTIPRAIQLALAGAVVVYAVVGATILVVLGPDGVAGSEQPLADAVRAGSWEWAAPLVRVGGAAAALGALLALLAGISRTSFAMAREGDLPRGLADVHRVHRVPGRAVLATAGVIVVLVVTVDLRGAIGFSSFGVLVYYLVANLSALRQVGEHRRFARPLQLLGAAGCLLLAATLPLVSVLGGAAVLLAGVVIRLLGRRR